jgi:hypothetical protein
MKGIDKFLIGIVAGIVLLVAAVLALALLRPAQQPSYQPDDRPEGVAHNYLLALQLEEYNRAYSYLSPTLPGYPGKVEAFERDVQGNRWNFGYADRDRDESLAVESANVSGDRARVVVRQTVFYRGSLFDSGQYSSTFTMTLRREKGAWKVTRSDSYWADCWSWSEGCR